MKAIAQLVVGVANLVEAEGRSLLTIVRNEARSARASAANLAQGFALLLIAVPLLIAGVGLLGAGLMWWLETQVSRPLAACLTGLAVIGVGGVCFACFNFFARVRSP